MYGILKAMAFNALCVTQDRESSRPNVPELYPMTSVRS